MADQLEKGSTIECFRHYATHVLPPKGARNSSTAKEPMARFIGVAPDAITGWLHRDTEPVGASLLKLRFFLDAVGYEVTELRVMQGTVNYMLAEMLAYDVVTTQEALELFGFSRPKTIYHLAFGKGGTSEGPASKIENHYWKSADALTQAKNALREQLGRPLEEALLPAEVPAATTTRREPSPPKTVASGEEDSLLELIANLVNTLTPHLERIVGTNRGQRDRLRKLVGGDGMFRLSIASSKLCSEKAREVMQQGTEG